jgi:hypothetical protein
MCGAIRRGRRRGLTGLRRRPHRRAAVLVTDLAEADGTTRWPTYRRAIHDRGIRFVYAIPIAIDRHYVGALTFFRVSSRHAHRPPIH